MAETIDVAHNKGESRFESTVDGKLSKVEYETAPGQITFTHTEVPRELSGRGIAQQMVKQALEHARKQKLRVVPQCAYVAAFIEKHPEYQDLVD
jgi:predicted GNAT family acetyltransferase